jgi:hypothetical protein
MTVRSRTLVSAVLGVCLGTPLAGGAAELPALPTASAVSPNQQLANAVAAALRQGDPLRHYRIDVSARDGTVEVAGCVAGAEQRDEVLRRVQAVAGVRKVVDRLTLLPAGAITPVQATAPPGGAAAPPREVPPLETRGSVPLTTPLPEPVPVFQAPMPSPYDLNPPHMPPYAWPTYAPYNNYSRVAYPLAYPYNAWPYIGPVHPFPKVPLGWRSVRLEWQDGHWWFSRLATRHDWWRLRYW